MSFHYWLWPSLVLVVVLVAVVVTYNRLVRLRLHIRESWANVDTELKRRHDLVPNLVEAVKAYARHERATLESLTRLRTQALAAGGDSRERRRLEADLVGALRQVFAVAEGYPQLRASRNFLQLQHALVETEDRIQAARRYYNGNVRDYNNKVQQFPSMFVAKSFRFASHEYFELPSLAERAVPPVAL